ncbi:hypothetical protein JOF56_009337 [Kibdelosporangium banguiense]|uniref:MmyB-like transcription regulator ligand binding domain-containing protein n=1 Tax=Kibdelosporangium banguiense TaxID=1365924 RepID=A0ABS4TX36_9PSEU|nr:hypothetical protein [Kibdelosporangium banguiense]MBP2328952.1 hypothetical protein [Kibdelosporangium banguiense]
MPWDRRYHPEITVLRHGEHMDRAELAAVLRTARTRVSPADVGLPAGSRRQVPGLRREEVAHLAWNPLAAALLGDYSRWPPANRNIIRQRFLGTGSSAPAPAG